MPDPKSIEHAQEQYNRKNIVIHKRRKAEMIGNDLKRDCPYCNCSGQMYDCDACNKIKCENCHSQYCGRCLQPFISRKVKDAYAAARLHVDQNVPLPNDRIAQIIANRDNIGALERMGAWIEKSKSEELHASCDVKQKASYSGKLRSKRKEVITVSDSDNDA